MANTITDEEFFREAIVQFPIDRDNDDFERFVDSVSKRMSIL